MAAHTIIMDREIEVSEKEKDRQIYRKSERKGEIKKNFSDISKAKEILGFSPSVELKDGVRRVYEWFKTKEIDEIRNAVILSGSE